MAQQIKKKFIGADQIDGSKIKLLQNQSIRGVNSLGQEVDLVKISSQDKIEVLGQEVALKSDLDQESSDRQSGDAATLASAQSYVDQQVADLVNSAPEVLDTLKELADALGGDANFATTIAGQIGAVDDRVDAEIARAEAAESELDGRLDIVEPKVSTLESEMNQVQSDVNDLSTSLSAEQTAREAADAALQATIDINYNEFFDVVNDVNTRLGDLETVDFGLMTRLDIIEGGDSVEGSIAKAEKDSKDYTDAQIAAIPPVDLSNYYTKPQVDAKESALDLRLDVLEAFGPDQTVHVSKNGSDSNSGKQHAPFLTITAALNAISDSSPSKRYVVKVSSGAYSEAIALKANVFVVGEGQKESVRITGAITMGSSFTANSSFDNRSGFANVSLLSGVNFDWNAVQSAAGKLYFSQVVFGSTLSLNGYNNAIAQAQFNSCVIFGNLTVSGINVGVFTNNVCYGNVTLNQHPNGGMATILAATGGYCSGTLRLNTTVNDFNRRCSGFFRSFPSENLIIDGVSSYADVDLVSQGKSSTQKLNGGQLVALTPKISHDIETQMIKPITTNAHNMGDWGKQWMWNFGYVHASSGTDLYLISYPESYAPDSSGKSIGIYSDGAGLQTNVNGGDIVLETASTSGTGVRGKIQLNGKEIDVTSKQIKNLADGSASTDAVNKGQLDSAIAAIPQITFNKESKTVDSTILSNQYINLAFEAKQNSIVMFVGRLAMIEGSDYSVSVVSGVSRITFLSPMLVPSPEALELGDIIHVTYAK